MVPYAFVWEKVKTMDFLENIVVYDIKVGRCRQVNEYMKLYEYQRSRSFIDLGPNHLDLLFLNFFSSITAEFNISSGERYRTNGPLVFFSVGIVVAELCPFSTVFSAFFSV